MGRAYRANAQESRVSVVATEHTFKMMCDRCGTEVTSFDLTLYDSFDKESRRTRKLGEFCYPCAAVIKAAMRPIKVGVHEDL